MKKNNWSLRKSMSSFFSRFHRNETSMGSSCPYITTLFAGLYVLLKEKCCYCCYLAAGYEGLSRDQACLCCGWFQQHRIGFGQTFSQYWPKQPTHSLTFPHHSPAAENTLMTTRDVIRVYFCTLLKSAESLCVYTRFFMSHPVKHHALV